MLRENVPDYAKLEWRYAHHHKRWESRVESRQPSLACQECGGRGGEIEPVLDYGQGPWIECDWCEGTGLVDNWRRAAWLGFSLGWEKHEEQCKET